MKKLLFVDVETTGVNPVKNGLIQLAGIIEIDGQLKESFDIKCQPFAIDTIENKALEVQKITMADVNGRQVPGLAYKQFTTILDRYVNKFEPAATKEKFVIVGQNPRFDYDFLSSWFKKNGNEYFYAYVDNRPMDLMLLIQFMRYMGIVNVPDLKLGTVAKAFGIEFQAHDAMSDIMTTRQIFHLIGNQMKEKYGIGQPIPAQG